LRSLRSCQTLQKETAAPKSGGRGVTPLSVAAQRYLVHVPKTPYWGTVRNAPSSFFTATVQNGDYLDVTQKAGQVNYFGEVRHSGFGYCGWILAANLDPNSNFVSDCPAGFTSPPAGFSQYINCETCNGGWGVQLQANTQLYRNVYPWNVPAGGYDAAGIVRPAGYTVYWRYVSEDGNWVAVSDPDPTPAINNQSWFFVPKSSLPTICGGGANAKPPTTPQRGPGGENWGLVCKSAAEGG
jgi:hypothetical protein